MKLWRILSTALVAVTLLGLAAPVAAHRPASSLSLQGSPGAVMPPCNAITGGVSVKIRACGVQSQDRLPDSSGDAGISAQPGAAHCARSAAGPTDQCGRRFGIPDDRRSAGDRRGQILLLSGTINPTMRSGDGTLQDTVGAVRAGSTSDPRLHEVTAGGGAMALPDPRLLINRITRRDVRGRPP